MVSPRFVIRQPSRLKWALCSDEWLMITPRLALPTAVEEQLEFALVLSCYFLYNLVQKTPPTLAFSLLVIYKRGRIRGLSISSLGFCEN